MTRDQIADEALNLVGTPFLHQGRTADGVDCVGFLAVILDRLGYPYTDVEGYRRTPSADVIRETMLTNFDEIVINDIGVGDILLMRIGGRKPKHAGVLVSEERDIPRGIEPQVAHAKGIGAKGQVVLEPFSMLINSVVTGFRLRGLED